MKDIAFSLMPVAISVDGRGAILASVLAHVPKFVLMREIKIIVQFDVIWVRSM